MLGLFTSLVTCRFMFPVANKGASAFRMAARLCYLLFNAKTHAKEKLKFPDGNTDKRIKRMVYHRTWK